VGKEGRHLFILTLHRKAKSQGFKFHLNQLQPSQLLISDEKLSRVLQSFDPEKLEELEPIPITKLGDEIIYIDGHTRALAAHQYGLSEIPVVCGMRTSWIGVPMRSVSNGASTKGYTPSLILKKGSSIPKRMKSFG